VKLLFLCSKNKLRSPTAECLFAEESHHEVDSAGLNKDAEIRLSDEQVRWADLIFVMEKIHRTKLNQRYQHVLRGKKVIVLGIPDHYSFMDEELITLLKQKCSAYLK